MKSEIESLEPYLKEIQELATTHKLAIVRGFLSEDLHLPMVNCEADTMEDVVRFIAHAVKLEAGLLILDEGKIESNDIENAISENEGDEDSDDAITDALTGGRSRVGTTGIFRLSFISDKPSAVFQIVLETTLNELLHGENEEDDSGDDYDSDDEPSFTEEEIQGFSNTLARDEKFQAASKNSQKLLVAKRVFSEQLREDSYFPLDDIMENATAIFEVDIKPSLNEALAEKAQELLDGGMSKKDIAKKLGISTERLSKLI